MTARNESRCTWLRATLAAGLLALLSGCATWQKPADIGDAPLRARAVTETNRDVELSATVLGSEDSLRMFGVDVNASGVQPVWIEVTNGTTHSLWLLRAGTDPDYFSPLEVAWSAHVTLGGKTNDRIDEHFDEMAFPNPIPPGETRSGILFTNPQVLVKLLNVDLLGDRMMVPFTLFLRVPGADQETYAERLQAQLSVERAEYEDTDALRNALEQMPCCTTPPDGEALAHPLNVVIIGKLDDISAALVRRGFRPVRREFEAMQTVFGRRPGLVVRQRAQAGASAMILRFWRAPINYRGQAVFLVQAGRPVGGRFVEIDYDNLESLHLYPDVDEVRNHLLQDAAYSGGLEQVGFVKGVGAASREQPRALPEGGSYFTDGYRVALFFATRPLTFADVNFLDWEPAMQQLEAQKLQELETVGEQ